MFAASSVFIVQTGGSIATAPASLGSAQMQVRQEMLTDTSDLLARRVDMNSHAYTFPLMYFPQQEVQITIPTGQTSQSVNLTGFRAGEVKEIVLWLTPTNAGQGTPGSGNFNPLQWSLMNNVVLTYNGEIFSRFDGGTGALWNLSANEKSSAYSQITQVSGSVAQSTASSPWLECPFAQVSVPYDKQMTLIHGKPILNAVVQLSFVAPATNTNYVLHAVYLYNSSLLCSRGSAEYIF